MNPHDTRPAGTAGSAPAGRERRTVTIRGPMTIYEAVDHKHELLAALADGDGLEIDLSEVDEMDTAGLQLLLLARREALRAGKAAVLVGSSAAAQEVLARYRLASMFRNDVAPESE